MPTTAGAASTTVPTGAPPTTAPASPPPAGALPAALLDLRNWKLTTDRAGPDGDALEIGAAALATYTDADFRVEGDEVVFTASVGGATTSGSSYPRTELREMTNGGKDRAAWSSTSGTHTMSITQRITAVPPRKPHIVAGQVHDSGDDIVMIRLEGSRLFVEGDGDDLGVLDASYALGTEFTVRIEAGNGRIKVFYNGALRVDHAHAGGGLYFKAGAYVQSNPSKGDAPTAIGQVRISELVLTHR